MYRPGPGPQSLVVTWFVVRLTTESMEEEGAEGSYLIWGQPTEKRG